MVSDEKQYEVIDSEEMAELVYELMIKKTIGEKILNKFKAKKERELVKIHVDETNETYTVVDETGSRIRFNLNETDYFYVRKTDEKETFIERLSREQEKL